MDLVVGATGFVGGLAARQLRALGREVRALVRGGAGHAGASALAADGVAVAPGDLADPPSLALACAGCDTVVCTATAMPNAGGDALRRIDHDGVLELMAAAEAAAVKRFVYISYSRNIRTESPLSRAKRGCEARLEAGRMEYAILQPSIFMEVWLGPHLGFDVAGGRVRVYGDGKAAVSYVSGRAGAAGAAGAAPPRPPRPAPRAPAPPPPRPRPPRPHGPANCARRSRWAARSRCRNSTPWRISNACSDGA